MIKVNYSLTPSKDANLSYKAIGGTWLSSIAKLNSTFGYNSSGASYDSATTFTKGGHQRPALYLNQTP